MATPLPARSGLFRYRVSRPSGCSVVAGSHVENETMVNRWLAAIRRMRGSRAKLLHLTDKQHVVAETTIELVLMDHRQPSREEIAAAVRRKSHTCSVDTVERTHRQLRDAGLLSWDNQYDVGWRITEAGVRVRQARQTVNGYTFHLPEGGVRFIEPEWRSRNTRRPHSCDRSFPDRTPLPLLPGFEPQPAGVGTQTKGSFLSIPPPADLLAARRLDMQEAQRRKQAERWGFPRPSS